MVNNVVNAEAWAVPRRATRGMSPRGQGMPYIEWRGSKCRVRWDTGKVDPETGKKLYDSKSGFTDEDEALQYGLDRESDIRNDRYISRRDGAVLMKDYCRTWPDTLDVGHLRELNVRSMIRLHIVPRWGETPVGDIKPSMYRLWEIALKAQPNIGTRYRGEILGVFSMMMDDAVEDGLRQSSPVKRKRRRGRYVKKAREQKANMLIEDVFQLALNALLYWGFTGFVFYLTMPFTCMRPGELYALRREYCPPLWPASDPDREHRKENIRRYAGDKPMPAIRVEFQHQWKNGRLELFPPKCESYRTLVIPQFLAELLEMLLASHDSEWAFPAIKGGPVRASNPSYTYWRRIADGREASVMRGKGEGRGGTRRPLPGWSAVEAYAGKRMYLLRHGGKEWLDEDGHSRVAVETRMGHELPGVEGVYSNVTPVMEQRIMETLQERWMRFVVTLRPDWMPASPTPLPVDLQGWMKAQVKAAQDAGY